MLEARSSHQPSSVLTRTPSIALTSAPSCSSRALTCSITANLRSSGQSKRISGVLTIGAMRSRHSASVRGAARQNAEQADRDVERVVVAVEAVGVEDVARHLARERRAHLGHLRLDQRMPGLPHDRLAAEARDLVVQRLARLDVGDDRRARDGAAAPRREDLQQLVAAHDPALAVDHADPIAIAVERDADLGAARRRPRPSDARGSRPRSDRDDDWETGRRCRRTATHAGRAAGGRARSTLRPRRRCRHPTTTDSSRPPAG